MSDMLDKAVSALGSKVEPGAIDFSAKFVVEDEGALMLDSDGVRVGDEEAEVTLTADADTFRAILDGDTSATSAFMSGALKVDGDMTLAMKLGAVLS